MWHWMAMILGDEQVIRRHSSWCNHQPNGQQQQQTVPTMTEQ